MNGYLGGPLVRQGLPGADMLVQGVRDVLHDDVGGVTLYLEVVDRGDVGKAENES